MHARILAVAIVAVSLLAAPNAQAAENDVPVPSAEIVPAPTASSDGPMTGSLRLTTVEVQNLANAEDAAAAQFAPRGSFWWVVGVIVVAGVILTVLL